MPRLKRYSTYKKYEDAERVNVSNICIIFVDVLLLICHFKLQYYLKGNGGRMSYFSAIYFQFLIALNFQANYLTMDLWLLLLRKISNHLKLKIEPAYYYFEYILLTRKWTKQWWVLSPHHRECCYLHNSCFVSLADLDDLIECFLWSTSFLRQMDGIPKYQFRGRFILPDDMAWNELQSSLLN